MKNLLLTLIFLFIGLQITFAQHEADNWYFGQRAGITFKNGNPTVLTDGQMVAVEGCATVSDKVTGELLFYTDGVKVWNKYHQIMKNGTDLKSGWSSTQAALIVPNPGNSFQYYIFTTPDLTAGSIVHTGLYYSLVSTETPEGEVIYKNSFLMDESSERLAATLDCSGKGFWVVAHHRNKGVFYSYHITSTGVSLTPVISKYTDEDLDAVAGHMKISPDRTKLVLGSYKYPSTHYPLLLFNFNPETGVITQNNVLGVGQNMQSCYGVSFSPDNTKLYATVQTETEVNCNCYIYQYDLSLSTPLLVQQSLSTYRIPLFSTDSSNVGALQLAPDGKIYVVATGQGNLGILNQPNVKGISYIVHGVNLEPRINRQGLPNYMDYLFNQPKPGLNPLAYCMSPPPHAQSFSDSGCIGSTLKFTDLSTLKPTKREWKFENGIPPTSTDSIVYVTFNQAGSNRVWLKVSNANGTDSTLLYAEIFPNPKAEAGADKVVCLGVSTELGSPSEAGNTYQWRPTTNLDNVTKANPTVTPITNGTIKYTLTVTSSNGCIAYDTVLVTAGSITANVSSDTTMCIGSSVQLMASGGSDYEWSPTTGLDNPNIPNPIASPNITTTYKVRVSSGSTCEDSATVTVTVNPFPTANAGTDQTPCKGEPTQLGAPPQVGNTYNWQPPTGLNDPAKSNPNASPTVTTEYILTVTNSSGCSTKD
ncbi:MAG: hypothetical protein HYZ42_18680, partial [Bacteroidetes bacterium]|nr:hypothetical protein [Bacteroidota bacterium]